MSIAKREHNWAEQRNPDTQRLAGRIVDMRRQRMTWRDISQATGYSVVHIRHLYDRALAEIPAQHVDEHRAEELVLIDDAIADLMTIARGETVSHRSRIEAWTSIRGWAERKAKLLGLDAPTQVVSIDRVDAEIAALTRELEALANSGAEDVPVEG